MRPALFSEAAVVLAGESLLAAGKNVTGFALRQKTGGGNPNRLKEVWEQHLAGQSPTRPEPAELPSEVANEVASVSQALVERLARLASDLNEKAVKVANRQVAAAERTAEEQRLHHKSEVEEAAQALEELEAKLDQSQTELESLKVRLEDELAASQAQKIELAQLRERAEKLAVDLEKSQADHSVARKEAAEARENVARLEGRLEALQARKP